MNNLNKAALLSGSQPNSDSSSEQSNASILAENNYLKDTLKQLINSANKNQNTQEKFYELELYFLESQSYACLLERVLNDLKSKLQLTQVELILVDHENEIQRLVDAIYNDLYFPNLKYVEHPIQIQSFYTDTIQLNLSQNQSVIRKLFSHTGNQCQSVAQIPLYRSKKIIGSLHLGSNDFERFHPDLATNFLQHLGSIISVCIENSINQERYIHLSLVDMLTRAKNRRYFFQSLAKEIARASRSLMPISCLFIDIDHFKNINDNKGHLVGDKALRAVVKSITPLLRQSDVLARFGGEEFTILLPECDAAQAMEIAERIRQKVEQLKIEETTHQYFHITISLGVSTWEPKEQQLENADAVQNYLINMADKAVYEAKEAGRNCIKLARI
ncbi:DUF484 family protein [Aliikangiella sp. IMCC44359]|uniref:DUF484 family protein n=1 Tax=Aliikangiella sp. IMCC44359 TaxID=3459125 RepID=UPI00403B0695